MGSLLNHQNSSGASSPRATTTSNAWVHTPPRAQPERWVDLSRFLLLSPSTPAVGSNVTCKDKKTQAVVFFFLILRYAPGLLSSPWFFVLSFFRWQIRWLGSFGLLFGHYYEGDRRRVMAQPVFGEEGDAVAWWGREMTRKKGSGSCRHVWFEEERNGCGAGLLCQWVVALSWP